MIRILATLLLLPSLAAAHDGLHPHPHGIEGSWVVVAAALAGAGAGWALARVQGRRN